MDDFSGAFVIPKDTPPSRKKFSPKPFLLFGILLITLPLFFFIAKKLFLRVNNPKETSLAKHQLSGTATDIHSQMFYLDLEYNEASNILILTKTGNINADQPVLLTSPLTSIGTSLNFKLQLLSANNELLLSGWQSIPKDLAPPNTPLRFRIVVPHEENSIIQLTSPEGKPLLTTKVI